MKIGVIGHLGIVGGATFFAMTKLGHDVVGYDIRDENKDWKRFIWFRPSIIFISVPTPISNDGNCDISIVEEVLDDLITDIKDESRYWLPTIIIKSTISPGTTSKFIKQFKYENIVFCPEFLRERCAIVDMVELHNLLAVGTYSDEIYNQVVECHGDYPKNVVKLTPTEAEFLKYYHNAIAALRIIFANEMYDLAEALNINYLKVKNALIKSTNLPNSYLDVSKNMRGFAGVCLPKDTLALLKLAEQHNIDLDLLETTIAKNQKYQPTVYPGMRLN